MMSDLQFIIGLARSGKSTFANKWIQYELDIVNRKFVERHPYIVNMKPFNSPPRVIVRADDIRLTFGQRFNPLVEDYVHAIKITMIKTLLLSGHSVLVDGTHTTKHSISQIFAIDPEADYAIVDTDVNICKQRAVDTHQEDLLPVIERMAQQMSELPPIEEIRNLVKDRKKV